MRPPLPAPRRCGCLLVRLDPAHVGLFRFLLEGYENLALFTVLERKTALLKLLFSPHSLTAVRAALADIAETVPLRVSDWPLPPLPPSPPLSRE